VEPQQPSQLVISRGFGEVLLTGSVAEHPPPTHVVSDRDFGEVLQTGSGARLQPHEIGRKRFWSVLKALDKFFQQSLENELVIKKHEM